MNHTRTYPPSVSAGASARRRIRRSTAGARALYCRTNGCTTFMRPEPSGGAVCPICGARARLH
jgi:hypothetical protein